jgi:hypothetical protein
MNIKEAAASLYERFRDQPWLLSVGIGDCAGRECLVLYVRSIAAVPTDLAKRGWEDFPVVVRKTSVPRPLAGPR